MSDETAAGQRFPELGFYTLAGAPESNRVLVDEVRQGEAMGFGTVFISERFNVKEAATLSGAAAAVSEGSAVPPPPQAAWVRLRVNARPACVLLPG